jgi:hypothetical protein
MSPFSSYLVHFHRFIYYRGYTPRLIANHISSTRPQARLDWQHASWPNSCTERLSKIMSCLSSIFSLYCLLVEERTTPLISTLQLWDRAIARAVISLRMRSSNLGVVVGSICVYGMWVRCVWCWCVSVHEQILQLYLDERRQKKNSSAPFTICFSVSGLCRTAHHVIKEQIK